MTRLARRSLLGGIGAVLAAPAIVRASSLMPVKAWDEWVSLLPQGFAAWTNVATGEIMPLDVWVEMNAIGKLMLDTSGVHPILMGAHV